MSTPWRHPGWFSTDKDTFSGSDLVQKAMIWSLFQRRAQSSIVWLHRSDTLFISNRATCSFYLLTLPRHSVSHLLRTWLNSLIMSHFFYLGMFHWGQRSTGKNATHAIKKLPSFLCLVLFGSQLTNPLLVTGSNSLPTLHVTSKATIFWS